MKAFDKFCTILDKIAGFITVVLMVFITVLIAYSVISRWIFDNPVAWQYEATLVCMSWITFLGMAITWKIDEHMRLTFIPNAMSPKMRKIWLAIMDMIVFCFMIWATKLSIGVVKTAMRTIYQTIPVSRGYFYLPFPIGCLFSACQIINLNYKRLFCSETADK